MSQGRLDLSSDPNPSVTRPKVVVESPTEPPANSNDQRKFIGMRFNCCGLYVRIYINREGTAYEGRCPKCAKPVRLKIGEGGTSSRFFESY